MALAREIKISKEDSGRPNGCSGYSILLYACSMRERCHRLPMLLSTAMFAGSYLIMRSDKKGSFFGGGEAIMLPLCYVCI